MTHVAQRNPIFESLEPQIVWDYFDQLTRIPRGSGNEHAVAAYVLNVAMQAKCEAYKDSIGNVIVRKRASSEKYKTSPIVTLQSHLDMVCEKNKNVVHDFTKDPIKLVRNGNLLGAEGTTLGADNGLGVATSLAIISSTNLIHGPLEFVFTVDEEAGFGGARNLTPENVHGRILLNLDSEDHGTFYVGCAGGCEVIGKVPAQYEQLPLDHQFFHISIGGLKGGHSGADIHLNRVNALKCGATFFDLVDAHDAHVVMIDGGNKRNALPRYLELIIAVPKHHTSSFEGAVGRHVATLIEIHKSNEPGISINIKGVEHQGKALHKKDHQKIKHLLHHIPHGVIAMSPDLEGLVETSTNLARIFTTQDSIVIETKQRSLAADAKQKVAQSIVDYFTHVGGHAHIGGNYPGWKPSIKSSLLVTAQKTFQHLFNQKAHVRAIHAGLECGEIGERIPGMDMISFGPNIINAHSPDECVEIDSVQPFWKLVTALLADLAKN